MPGYMQQVKVKAGIACISYMLSRKKQLKKEFELMEILINSIVEKIRCCMAASTGNVFLWNNCFYSCKAI